MWCKKEKPLSVNWQHHAVSNITCSSTNKGSGSPNWTALTFRSVIVTSILLPVSCAEGESCQGSPPAGEHQASVFLLFYYSLLLLLSN